MDCDLTSDICVWALPRAAAMRGAPTALPLVHSTGKGHEKKARRCASRPHAASTYSTQRGHGGMRGAATAARTCRRIRRRALRKRAAHAPSEALCAGAARARYCASGQSAPSARGPRSASASARALSASASARVHGLVRAPPPA